MRNSGKILILALTLGISLLNAAPGIEQAAELQKNYPQTAQAHEYIVPNRLVMKVKDYQTSRKAAPESRVESFGIFELDNDLQKLGVQRIERSFPEKALAKSASEQALARFFYLTLNVGEDLDKALYLLNNNSFVDYAETIPIHRTNVSPNDPQYRDVNGTLRQVHYAMVNAEAAWDINTGGSDIIVAIIDTGVDWQHEDLQAKIWVNEDETEDGTDSDGNGYIDDVRGWDFVHVSSSWTPAHDSEDGDTPDNDPMDVDGHGTHCSGIAAAATDNSIGVAGTNWGATVMPVRVGYLTEEGTGSIPFGYDGVVYAADNGAHVLSLSWGGGSYNQYAQDIMDYAWGKGCVIIAAAGNDDSPDAHYPSAYNHVVAVAATGNVSDNKANYSNYGPWVDISAPGTNILATYPGNAYARLQGTSMSCPMVAGAAALIISQFPAFSNHDVVTQLVMTSDNIDEVNDDYIGMMGYGRVNMEAMLQEAQWSPNLMLENIRIDDSAGNNNGFADPGETVDLILDMRNAFLGGAISAVNLSLSTDDYAVTLNTSSASIGDIAAETTVSNSSSPFSFTVESTAISHRAEFSLLLTDDSGYSEEFVFSYAIGVPSILYVDDDDGANNVESYYFHVLDSLGISYEYWDHMKQGTPGGTYLKQFASVIWSCEWSFPSLDAMDRNALTAYLNDGGNLFLSGQDIGWDMCANAEVENEYSRSGGASKTWYENYLSTRYLEDDGSPGNELWLAASGVGENPITGGMEFSVSQPGRPADNQYPSVVEPMGDAVSVVQYSTGDVGATMVSGDYNVLNFAFGYEAVMEMDVRTQIMANTMQWLNGLSLDHVKVPDTEDESSPVEVSVAVASDFAVDSAAVYWSLNGNPPFTISAMSTSDDLHFNGEIPANANGSTVYYFLYVQNEKGYFQTFPSGAPGNMLSYSVGPDATAPVIGEFTAYLNTIDNSGAYPVYAKLSDNLGLDPDNTKLIYRLNSAAEQEVPFERIEADDHLAEMLFDSPLANGDTVSYQLQARDLSAAANESVSEELRFVIVSNQLLEDFETDLSGWNADGSWEQYFYPYAGSFSITDSPTGYYPSDAFITLENLKAVNLSSRSEAYLHFWNFYAIHETDRAMVQATADDGATWTTLSSFYGQQFQWTERVISLNDFIGEPAVRYRFVIESDALDESDGLYIDEISVFVDTTMDVTSVDGNTLPQEFSLSQNYPNPFNPATTIEYALPELADVKITIYNIQGKEIFSREIDQQAAGYHEFTWMGRDNTGVPAASGLYFMQLSAGDDMATRKMLLIK